MQISNSLYPNPTNTFNPTPQKQITQEQDNDLFSKAFREPTLQDLREITNPTSDFQKSMTDNLLFALCYCEGRLKKGKEEDLKAFSQDDFKNAKTNATQSTNKTFENYPLDSYGFLGDSFLKEAGLPEDLKFHSNSLQAIKNYLTLPFYEHNSEDGNAYFSNYFNSVDLGGGLKEAFEELENFIPIKDSYTKAELLEAFKNDKDFMDIKLESDIPLIVDYTTTENGSEKIALEGVILLFSLSNYGEAYAKSDKSELGEYGKYLAGLPNSWLNSPTILKDSTFQETRKIVTKSMTDWFLQEVLGLGKTEKSKEENPFNTRNQSLKYLGMESDSTKIK